MTDISFNESDPVVIAFQTLEGFKGEWSERPGPQPTLMRTANVGEAWVMGMLERHGIGFTEATACGLWVCKPTVDGILRFLTRREITQRQALETTFYSGWFNGLGTGAELHRG